MENAGYLKEPFQRTKLVLIYDKYSITNFLDEPFELRQPGSDDFYLLHKNSTISLVLSTSHDQSHIQVRLALKGWLWSDPFSIVTEDEGVIQMVNLYGEARVFISISTRSCNNGVMRVTFRRSDPLYRIENHSSRCLRLHQKDAPEPAIHLEPQHESYFAWTSMVKARQISLDAIATDDEWSTHLGDFGFDDGMSVVSESFSIRCRSDGLIRVILVHDELSYDLSPSIFATRPPIQIRGCVSCIKLTLSTTEPRILFNVAGVHAAYSNDRGTEDVYFALKSINVHNLYTAANFNTLFAAAPSESLSSCMSIELKIAARNSSGISLDYLNCNLSPITFFVHGLDILILLNEISQAYFKYVNFENEESFLLSSATSSKLIESFAKQPKRPLVKMLRLKQLIISGIQVLITIKSPLSHIQSEEIPECSMLVFIMVQWICNALASFDSSNIELRELNVSEFWGTEEMFLRILKSHYNLQILVSLTQMLASLSILGAPLQSFGVIKSAIIELLSAPLSSTNPLVALSNTLYQSTALLSACTGSITLSLSRLSSSVNAGIISTGLGSNDSMMRRRSLPVALLTGVEAGIEGAFREPLNGYRGYGIRGGLLGLVRGAIGVVITPASSLLSSFSGSLDYVSSSLIPRHLNPLNQTETTEDTSIPFNCMPQVGTGESFSSNLADDSYLDILPDRVCRRSGAQSSVLFLIEDVIAADVWRASNSDDAHIQDFSAKVFQASIVEAFPRKRHSWHPMYGLSIKCKSSHRENENAEDSTYDFLFLYPKEAQKFLLELAYRRQDISITETAEQFMKLLFVD